MDISNLSGAFGQGEGQEEILATEVAWPEQLPGDKAALKLVVQDYQKADSYLNSRLWPAQWFDADVLWNAQVPLRPWAGTDIPRANLGIPLVLLHVESILPQVILGFFSDPKPFDLDPLPGTQSNVARANADILAWELIQTKFREEFLKTTKSALLYGTGVGKWGWETSTQKRKRYIRKGQPAVVSGGPATEKILPADYDEVEVKIEEVETNRPFYQHVNLRHIKVDPGLRVPDIREAGYVIHVMYMSVEEIDRLRTRPGFKDIPSREDLIKLVTPSQTEAPIQNSTERSAGPGLSIGKDFNRALPRAEASTVDPLQQPFQVLEYWTNDKVYMVLQEKLVIYNEINPYGRIPFVSCPFVDNMDCFYGKGVAHLIGPIQRLQQGVTNLGLDTENMRLGGAFVHKRGFNAPMQEIRLAPGKTIALDDPQGFKALEFPSMLGDSMSLVEFFDRSAQRYTGADEMAVQGQMPSKGSNVLRTATGVNMLTSGTGTRLQHFMERLADLVFIPTLEAFNEMNGDNLKPSQYSKILSQELNQAFEGDPLDIKNGCYKFRILAGARLQNRRAMQQNLPLFYQLIANDPFKDQLSIQGKKVSFEELVNMLYDVSGWQNKQSLIVDMTAEDKQRLAAMTPGAQQGALQGQKIQQQAGAQSQLLSQKNEERVASEIIRHQLKEQETGE